MWTPKDIAEAALLIALIASAPFVYAFFSKMATYLLNRYIPRDTVVEVNTEGQKTRRYLVIRRIFSETQVYEVTTPQEDHREMHI